MQRHGSDHVCQPRFWRCYSRNDDIQQPAQQRLPQGQSGVRLALDTHHSPRPPHDRDRTAVTCARAQLSSLVYGLEASPELENQLRCQYDQHHHGEHDGHGQARRPVDGERQR
jgi:hypothetical protein